MDGTAAPPVPAHPQPEWVKRRRISAADFHRMGEAGILRADDRVELIEGELIAMSPIGRAHVARVMVISQLLFARAAGRCVVSVQMPVRLNDYSEPEPDLALVQGPPQRYLEALPRAADTFLLIEVADTTLAYDTTVKAALYGRSGVAEYWVVDLAARVIRLHREPNETGYAAVRQAAPDEVLEPVLLPGLRLPVADLLA
jgi:Uma2 family endonuclease